MDLKAIIENIKNKIEELSKKEFNEQNLDEMIKIQELKNLISIHIAELGNFNSSSQVFAAVTAGTQDPQKAERLKKQLEELADKLEKERVSITEKVNEMKLK